MIILLILFVLLLIILQSWLMLIKDAKKTNVPGPFPLPLIGNANLFFVDKANMLSVFERLANKYNDAFRFYIYSNRYVALSHPKYVEAKLLRWNLSGERVYLNLSGERVYLSLRCLPWREWSPIFIQALGALWKIGNKELIDKGRQFDILKPWLGEGLISASGAKWKKNRRTLTPSFHFNALKSFLPVFLKNEKILRAKLKNIADGTTPIDIMPLISAYSFDNISEAAMGICFHAQTLGGSEYARALEEITHIVGGRLRNPFLANDFLFRLTPYKAKWDKAIEVFNKYSYKAITSSREKLLNTDLTTLNNEESGTKFKSFIDLVLLGGQNGNALDDEQIISEVNTFLFAGHDTVSTTASFALYCISNHKNVQLKLYEEQKSIFGDDMDRDPTHSDLQEMKYLDLVLKEVLRLYPIGAVIERLISKDADLAGLHLPKDTLVAINIFQLQRNPLLYENPLEFCPERFENNDRSPFSWIPFSAGPRNCIGQRFAILQLKVILSSIVKHFQLFPSRIELVLTADLALKSESGMNVKILPRVGAK